MPQLGAHAAPQAVAPQAPAAAYTPPTAPQAQDAHTPAAAPARPAPWEDMPPAADGGAAVLEAPARVGVASPAAAPQYVAPAPQAKAKPPVAEDDDLPPWVTEFSDDSAMPAQGAAHPYAPEPATQSQSVPAQQANDPHAIAMPARAAPAPAKAPYAYVITPVPELNWDGNWPAVAAALPLRGTAQQLAMQAEMVKCYFEGNAFVIALRVPIETWRTPGNIEKLTTALTERFGRTVRVDSDLGAVWYTASAEAQAYREACQRAAEETIANDPFVNSMIRELDAWVVPSSIVPPQSSAAAAA
jgi:DNA polymerase-3 subunit gamma/tau